MNASISEKGHQITVTLTPDQLSLINCALFADRYHYSAHYIAMKQELALELAHLSTEAGNQRADNWQSLR